jgi:hypothetical protein
MNISIWLLISRAAGSGVDFRGGYLLNLNVLVKGVDDGESDHCIARLVLFVSLHPSVLDHLFHCRSPGFCEGRGEEGQNP